MSGDEVGRGGAIVPAGHAPRKVPDTFSGPYAYMTPDMKSIVCSFALVLLMPFGAQGDGPLIPRDHAIKIAAAKMLQMGYDLTEMDAQLDEDNKKWNEFLEGKRKREKGKKARLEFEKMDAKLHGKQFWNITYKWKPRNGGIVLGGVVVFVLVDANNGEIILVIEPPCPEECKVRPWSKRSLQYINAREHKSEYYSFLPDSIPIKAKESVVLYLPNLQAQWVVAIISLPSDMVREEVRRNIEGLFGIETEEEIQILPDQFRTVHPHKPETPLFGPGLSDFHVVAPAMRTAVEYRIVTKQYNLTKSLKGFSRSEWRIVDGAPIFGRPLCIIVVTRTDERSEWARDHTGLAYPFRTRMRSSLVTDKEVRLIDSLSAQARYATSYFLPYPGYKTNAVIQVMKSIRKAAEESPGND